ncbi:hypothetical protein [Solemya velum gill symbiont]|uniref:hypothetical protein n=1 Tax=Solemya velum gill symbiont TaxID=2340 RepID=UPI0009CAC6B9|nr:hypothetical protein [Solemya velum gill symbiont]OOY67277.1 hypothetical protein BOW06_07230 [Solemya velum gill symbiont]OOY94992.1 hypothetical protein BOW18_11130 [Solemya velum gill symbiont]
MSNQFKVGELVIMQKADYWLEHDGMLAVVIEPYANRYAIDLRTVEKRWEWTYVVKVLMNPARVVAARPDQMRKLRDDSPESHIQETAHEKLSKLNSTHKSSEGRKNFMV